MNIEWFSEKDRNKVLNLAKNNRVTARRIERIKAAHNFYDLEASANGRAHFLQGKYEGYFALDLKTKTSPERLICKPIGDYKMSGKQYVKETVTEFMVIKIEQNYHKK